MKTILTLSLLLCSVPCVAQEKILYSENGVIFGYSYEKIDTITDSDCPEIKFDEYKIIAKVENKNNKAIDLNMLDGRLYLKNEGCTKAGNLQIDDISYGSGLFLPHRYYATVTPNTGFGAAHAYFLDAHDEYSTPPGILRVRVGNTFPEPDWYFPKWKFIDVPNKDNTASTTKSSPQSSNISTDYAKLILGKWRFSIYSTYNHGKEIEPSEQSDQCFDMFEANNRVTINIGDCNNSQEAGKWSIVGKILTTTTKSEGEIKYEILKLDKSTLKLKNLFEYDVDRNFISTYERVTQ